MIDPDTLQKNGNIPAILTAEEVSESLGISKRKTYELMNQPDFPCIEIGRSKRVPLKQFEDWIRNQSSKA